MNNIEIRVACYKKIELNFPSPYLPICNVNEGQYPQGFETYDDSKINISEKNKEYAELSAQYWLWKNSNAKVKGIIHYRRFFVSTQTYSNNWYFLVSDQDFVENFMLSERGIENLLLDYSIIVARREEMRALGFKNAFDQFSSNHPAFLIYEVDTLFEQKGLPLLFSTYLHNALSLSFFNMVIAHSDIFDSYSVWLFEILADLEPRIGNLSGYQRRWPGFLGERLLNYWIDNVSGIDSKFIFEAQIGIITESNVGNASLFLRRNKILRKVVLKMPNKWIKHLKKAFR
jgi:hypothetical protein